MEKLLEVREFDKISCNPDFKTEYAYLPEKVFRDFEEFIHAFAGDDDHADALEFLKIGYRRNVGDIISVSNYVGLIQMHSGYQIQVLPKIDFGDPTVDGEKETKRVFLRMLRSMKDFPSKVFNEANLKMDRMTLYEIFINMYLQEVRTLVKHGIKSAYIAREDNLNFYKGKLVVNEHIKRNIAHQERFHVRYDEYLVDRAENRLVKATLFKLQGISGSAENQKEIRQLLTAFEMVRTYFEKIGMDTSFDSVCEETKLLTDYYEKQKEEEFIQEKIEQIIGVMKLLGLDAGNLAEYSTDVLSKVFNLGDMEYFAGMKLFNRVIDRLSINMDRQGRYEVFDRIYEEGMREKKVERDRNSR